MKIFSLYALAAVLPFSALPAFSQTKLTDTELTQTLQVLDESKTIDIAALRKKAIDSVAANRGPQANLREPLSQELDNLSQFTVEIQFKFGSAAILPASFRTLGVIADSLHHPSLLQYRFVIVGHTDAVGGRQANLELSQKRADAVRDALVTTFRIAPSRVDAVGLGEEQLLDNAHPDAAINRRVQLVNVGRFK